MVAGLGQRVARGGGEGFEGAAAKKDRSYDLPPMTYPPTAEISTILVSHTNFLDFYIFFIFWGRLAPRRFLHTVPRRCGGSLILTSTPSMQYVIDACPPLLIPL